METTFSEDDVKPDEATVTYYYYYDDNPSGASDGRGRGERRDRAQADEVPRRTAPISMASE